MANNLEIATLPIYDGQPADQTGKNQMTAESFLDRLTAFTDTIPAGAGRDQQRIARTTAQLRGSAATWWSICCGSQARTFEINRNRVHNNWEYFCTQFKKRFFEVQDHVDTVADISDIKQHQHEKPHHYAERLTCTITTVNQIWRDGIQRTMRDDTFTDYIPAALRNYLNNPGVAANALTEDQRATHLNAMLHAFAEHHLDRAVDQQAFIQVCRSIGRNALDKQVRSKALKILQDPNATIGTLLDELRKEFASQIKPPNQPRFVAATDGYPMDSAAVRGGFRGRGRGGRGRGGSGRGGAQRNPDLYCRFCNLEGSHKTDECNKLGRLIEERAGTGSTGNGNNSSSQVDAAGQGGARRRNNNNNGNQRQQQKKKPKQKTSAVSQQDDYPEDDEDEDCYGSQRVTSLEFFPAGN